MPLEVGVGIEARLILPRVPARAPIVHRVRELRVAALEGVGVIGHLDLLQLEGRKHAH